MSHSGAEDTAVDDAEEHTDEPFESLSFREMDIFDEERHVLLRFLNKAGEKVKKRDGKATNTHLKDKIAFMFGVTNISVMCGLLGVLPEWMIIFYTIKFCALITIRFVMYRPKKWHYFLLDFCYFANLCLVFYLHFFPGSPILFMMSFAFASGPLAWAIVAWKNAMVFHSMDKITSLFIHLSPAMVTYQLRWFSRPDAYEICVNEECTWPFLSSMGYCLAFYMCWQLMYYIVVEVQRGEKVKKEKYLTSKVYMGSKDNSFLGTLKRKYGEENELVLFMATQLLFTVLTLLPVKLMFEYQWLHTLFILFVSQVSLWNGANFYIDAFDSVRRRKGAKKTK